MKEKHGMCWTPKGIKESKSARDACCCLHEFKEDDKLDVDIQQKWI